MRQTDMPKPYDMVRKWHWWLGFVYIIRYDETALFIRSKRDDAKSLTAALNGAFQEGIRYAETTWSNKGTEVLP